MLHFNDVMKNLFSLLLNILFHYYILNHLSLNLLLPLINYLNLILFQLDLQFFFIFLLTKFHQILRCNYWNHMSFIYFKINQNHFTMKTDFCLILIRLIIFHFNSKIKIFLIIWLLDLLFLWPQYYFIIVHFKLVNDFILNWTVFQQNLEIINYHNYLLWEK